MSRPRMVSRGAVTLVLAGLTAAATVPAHSQQSVDPAKVLGVLLNGQTRAPVPEGLVRLVDPNGRIVRATETDREGRFSISTPGPGAYYLQAEHLGYRTKESGEFVLPPGHVLSVEVHLSPTPQDTATAVIEGLLLDEQAGTPVPQAEVRLINAAGETVMSVSSDGEGRFSLQTPGLGPYHLQVAGIGYQTKESGEFTLPAGHVLSVEIRCSPDPLPLDSLEVLGHRRPLRPTEQLIQGRLRDFASGEPIPQGTVSLWKAFGSEVDQANAVTQAISDPQGVFTLVTPLPGTYRLKGERMGYRASDSPEIHLMPGDTVLLDLIMSVEAIVMDPIIVRASARPWGNRYNLLGMDPFFYRQSRFAESGFGTFLTRDSLANYDGRMDTARMLLATAMEVRMVNEGGGVILAHGCNPRYYLDGAEIVRGDPVRQSMLGQPPDTPVSEGFDPELLYPPETLEGIEVYVSPTIPVEFSQGYPCGVVALWTRRRR